MTEYLDPQKIRDDVRRNLCKYTRRAFGVLPAMENPRILDIGCGSGVPTIELAKFSKGKIVALDIDGSQLELLERKLQELRLEDRIEILNRSITNIDFDDNSFDLIWSEGSIYVPGFKAGLNKWRRFLKPGGFMVIHDERGDIDEKLRHIVNCGYEILDYFILDRDIWWNEYYSPLEGEIRKLQNRYSDESDIRIKFAKDLREIELFKKGPEKFESAFFIIQKGDI